MTTTPTKSDEPDLVDECLNYMAELWTLCAEVRTVYPDWDKKLGKKNRDVMKRVLKMSRRKKQ